MTRVLLHGCNGRMGQAVTALCSEDDEIRIVAGVDVSGQAQAGYPVFPDICGCGIPVDVVIDFTTAPAVDALLKYCVEKRLPVVLCTTGLSAAQEADVKEAAKSVAVLKSANMSLGINTLMELLKPAAQIFAAAGFDIEIVEKHHNQKLDAPSGTALALADSMNDALGGGYGYCLDRSAERKKRDQKEIGIQAVRGGTLPGEHEVIFAGMDEVVTFRHTAYSRSIFAKGAIQAAKFLNGKPAGLYGMADVVGPVR